MGRYRLGPRVRRAYVLAFASLILGLVCVAQVVAQQPRRIGRLLMIDPCPPNNIFVSDDTLTQVLAERGWIQGQNLLFECVSAGGRLGDVGKLAAELVARQPELLVTQSTPAIRALVATKTTIPIVIGTPDPVGEGFVQSLARPGGNITGAAEMNIDLVAKRIELAREIMPESTNVAVLWREGGDERFYKLLEAQLNRAVDRFGIRWRVYVHPNRPEGLEPSFQAMQQDGYNLVYVLANPFTFPHRKLISELALKYGIRVLTEQPQFPRDGALLSYGFNVDDVQRPMAARIDAILRGAKPETLPIEQVTKLHLILNLKTARALGVEIPPDILARADEVIE